jgi:hypothetical protein
MGEAGDRKEWGFAFDLTVSNSMGNALPELTKALPIRHSCEGRLAKAWMP